MKRINVPLLLILAATVLALAVGVVALNRFQVARNAGSLAARAREKRAEGKNDEALKLLAKYVGLRPNDAAANAEFATLLLERSEAPGATRADFSRAFNALEGAVRRAPDDNALRLKLAEFDIRIGRFGDAREHLDALRERVADGTEAGADTPSPTAIEVLRARALAGLGDFTAAARVASELVGFDMQEKSFDESATPAAETTEAYIVLAAILEEKLRDSASASRVIDQLVRANEKDPRAWLAAARWHRQRGDLKKTGEAVARATALAPDDIDTMLTQFDLALANNAPQEAAAVIARGLEKHPDDARMNRAKAMLEVRQGDPDKAVETLRGGLERLPKEPGLLLMLADVLLQQEAIPEAEAVIRELGEAVGAANPVVGLLEARVLLQQRKWLPAKAKLEQVRPLVAGSDEQIRQVDLYLGQCYERLGQFDEQLEANRRVLSDDPTSLAARVGAASALVAAGKPDESLVEFETVAAAIPADRLPAIPQVWGPLLQLRVAAQMKRPAVDRDWTRVDSLLDLLQASPAVSQTQMTLLRADVLVRKEEREAARELLTEAVKTDPAEPQVRAGLVQLTLRDEGVAAAKKVLAATPARSAKTVPLLLLDAQIASREQGDEKQTRLTAIEAAAADLGADDALRLLMGLASIRLADGNRQEAERLWQIVAARSPDDLAVRTALYELAREAGDSDKAARLAAEISAIAGPTSPQARLAQAGERVLRVRQSRLQKGRDDQSQNEPSGAERKLLDEARNLLIEAENDRPGWSQIQQMFAEVEGLRGNVSAAIERMQRAVKMGPANPAVVRQLVALLYAANRLAEAQEALAQLGPDGLQGTERISAEMEMRAGKFDEAITLAERSVSLDSADADDLLWFGQLLSRSRKAQRAEEVLERAVSLAPEKPQTWLTLFAHQIATDRRRQAQRTLDRAAAALEEPERSLVAAQGREMMGDFAAAEKAYEEAVAAAPNNMDAARTRTTFLLRRGRLGPARQALEKMVAVEGSDAATRASKAWGRRVLAELVAGRGSYRDLEKGLSILRQNADPDGRLPPEDATVEIALLAGRPEPASWRRALTQLEALAEKQPLSTAQRLQLAELCDKTGRWEDCRDELISLVGSPAASPSIYAILIEKLLAHDELSTSRIWLQKLRQLQPDAPVTLALEAKLALAEKDRPTAVAAAKKLMPSFPVSAEQAGQLRGVAKVMEDLGFPKAADKILTEMASRSPEGVIARAEFLGRQKRPTEAFNLLEKAWNSIPLERMLQTGLIVARAQGPAPSAETREVIDRWFTKARRSDPDSIIVQLLQAEWLGIEGKGEAVESLYRELLSQPKLEPTQEAIVANNLAFHLARPETASEALKLVERAIETLGPHPDLLDTRGIILLAAGRAPEALEDLQQAVLAPSASKFLHLAMAQAEARQPEAAKRSLDKARGLGLDPTQLPAADKARLEKLERELAEKVAGA
jgi:tetratricopeptide (TPR) repeat protein